MDEFGALAMQRLNPYLLKISISRQCVSVSVLKGHFNYHL